MEIIRLHHAHITVAPADVEAARAFYLGTLHLEEIPKPDSLLGRGGFWVRLADQQIHVGVEDGVNRAATKAHLAYQVSEIETWREFFSARGVEVKGNDPIPGYDRFEFRDPFGNRLEFIAPMVMLVRPHLRARESFLAAVNEFQAEGRYLDVTPENVDSFISQLLREDWTAHSGKVPDTILWLVEGDHFIGRLSIRHHLNEQLEKFGGHIGYEIRPSERGKGYGTLILRLGKAQAAALGLTRVLVTCDATNERSIRVIKANGGVLQDRIPITGHDVDTLRWWIDLTTPY